MRMRFTDASLVVTAGGALLFAALAFTTYLLADAHSAVREPFADLQGRYARLAGMREMAPQIERSLADVSERLSGHVHTAAMGADRVGTDLQQRARRVAEEAGMTVTGSQILPVRPVAGFAQVPVTLTVEGSLEALRAMLLGLGMERPSIVVDSVVIEAQAGDAAAAAQLTAQMNISVLQLQP